MKVGALVVAIVLAAVWGASGAGQEPTYKASNRTVAVYATVTGWPGSPATTSRDSRDHNNRTAR